LESVKGSGIFHPLAQKSPVNGLIEWPSGWPWRCNQLWHIIWKSIQGFQFCSCQNSCLAIQL